MTGQMSLFQDPKKEDRLTIMEAARLLGVSRATAGNWQKAGRLKPCYEEEGRQYFSRQELLALLERIKNGQEGLLRQRRNKTQISGHLLQQDYAGESCTLKTVTGILDRLRSLETELAEPLDPALTLRLLLAEYALKQLALSGLLSREEPRQGGVSGPLWERSLLEEYLKGRLEAGVYEPLIRSLLEQAVPLEEAALLALRPAFTVPVEWGKEDDLLGLLYLALNPLNRRKREGAFYTPAALTREMADSLWRQGLLEPCRRIWDPACGCGNFLLAVYHRTGSLEGLYGSDIDPLAVTLSRLNLILASKARDIRGILERVRQEDSLYRIEASFDLVLANPPWGQRLSGRQQSFLRRVYATGAGRRQIESFDVFGELALRTCRPGGTVALVLPEAFLQAEAHACLRRLFREESQLKRLHLWGNIFQGIQCPALTIEAKRAPGAFTLEGVEIVKGEKRYVIKEERREKSDFWKLTLQDEEFHLLQEIAGRRPTFTLAGQAKFALGIVTGENRRFLKEEPGPGREPIWTGAQVFSYHLAEPRYFIQYRREEMQQAAPEQLYRARRKLIYRFICRLPVFAWDEKGSLSLNSANILIPQARGYSKKYILAALNSRPARFYFLKSFPTMKVLKRQIESLPLPAADRGAQRRVERLVNRLLGEESPEERRKLYERIDRVFMELYGLTKPEEEQIRQALAQRDLFLL